MRIRNTLALAVAALAIGVPVATADPDGYQPQLKTGAQLDVVDRYLRNNAPDEQPDSIDRYLGNSTSVVAASGAAGHPDSRALRPSPPVALVSVDSDGRDWTTHVLGALGGACFMFLAIVGASAIRDRRRLVLR